MGDGRVRAQDDGSRRVLACGAVPPEATPETCLAAWHAVAHALGHDGHPVSTLLFTAEAPEGFVVSTQASTGTSMAQLLAEVSAQCATGMKGVGPTARARELPEERPELPAVCIDAAPGAGAPAPQAMLIRGGGHWSLSCCTSRYAEEIGRAHV